MEQRKAFSYIRFSSRQQALGDSLRRQVDASRAYAKEHDFELDESFRDPGKSAFSGEHAKKGAFGRFLALIETGAVPSGSVLLIESLDRISRESVYDAYETFRRILAVGIEIITLDDGNRYSEEDLRQEWTKLIVVQAIMSRGHNESQLKSLRSIANWSQKKVAAKDGRIVTPTCPAWLTVVANNFQVNEERSAIVSQIYEMAADGMGQYAIAQHLNKVKANTFGKSTDWQPSSIAKILTNAATIGIYQAYRKAGGKRIPDGDPVSGYFPAIIPEPLYWRVRAARTERRDGPGRGAGRRGKAFTNVFRGIARCACGGAMIYRNDYVFCDRNNRGLSCTNGTYWRYSKTEPQILAALNRIDWSNVLNPNDYDEAKILEKNVETLRAQIADSQSRKARWIDRYESGDDDAIRQVDTHNAKLRKLTAELRSAEATYNAAATSPTDATFKAALIDDLNRQQSELVGDALYRLRSRLNVEVSKVVDRLEFIGDDVIAFYRRSKRRRVGMLQPEHMGFSLIQGRATIYVSDDS